MIDAIDLVGIAVLCFKQRFPGGDHENLDDFGAIETARHFIDGLKG